MIKVICQYCEKVFDAYPHDVKRGRKYCNQKCYGLSLKGKPSNNKGKPSNRKGKTLSKETIRKMSIAQKGKKHTDEHNKNVSEALKGLQVGEKNPSWKGGKIEIVCQYCGKLREVYPCETKNGRSKFCNKECYRLSRIGKKLTVKHRKNISKSLKIISTKEFIKKRLKRRIPSSLEKKFLKIIQRNNLPYKYVGNGSFIIENCNPDFINTDGKKIAIEVYARYYKNLDKRNIDDWKEKRAKIFNKYGWNIIYFDETEVNENNIMNNLIKPYQTNLEI